MSKQPQLFDTHGNPDQMDLFGDCATPPELVLQSRYRFENGSLYELDEEGHFYLHCLTSPYATTEEEAIAMHEARKALS